MVFVGASGVLAWRSRHYPVLPESELLGDPGPGPTWTTKAFWVLLAAIPSVLMLTVTTYLTQDIAAIPFLWIVPLVIYLLTFIPSVSKAHDSIGAAYTLACLVALGVVVWAVSDCGLGVIREVLLFSMSLFVCAMFCHGELARNAPHPRYPTGFYLSLSVGGQWAGSSLGFLAPLNFGDLCRVSSSVGGVWASASASCFSGNFGGGCLEA